jgi:DNA-binding transcriptional regulator YhcF (GntR family)
MSFFLNIDHDAKTPKYKQIVKSVIGSIERGVLKQHDQLPSINELSEDYYLARDTVEKAYKELKALGVIDSVRGKGFYILNEKPRQIRVLLVMNKLSAYKKAIYESFVSTLSDRGTVTLQIHHGSFRIFRDILKESLGQFHYYVIMPHFYNDVSTNSVLESLKQIPGKELILLDKEIPELINVHSGVYQDFTNDLYGALESGRDLLEKYKELVLVFPKDVKYPPEIVRGFRNFCAHFHKNGRTIDSASSENDLQSRAYIVLEDSDLAELVKKAKLQGLVLGKEVGVVAFNDTPLKEVLADGITVVSTNHEQMGFSAANLILDGTIARIKNPFGLIRRGSL